MTGHDKLYGHPEEYGMATAQLLEGVAAAKEGEEEDDFDDITRASLPSPRFSAFPIPPTYSTRPRASTADVYMDHTIRRKSRIPDLTHPPSHQEKSNPKPKPTPAAPFQPASPFPLASPFQPLAPFQPAAPFTPLGLVHGIPVDSARLEILQASSANLEANSALPPEARGLKVTKIQNPAPLQSAFSDSSTSEPSSSTSKPKAKTEDGEEVLTGSRMGETLTRLYFPDGIPGEVRRMLEARGVEMGAGEMEGLYLIEDGRVVSEQDRTYILHFLERMLEGCEKAEVEQERLWVEVQRLMKVVEGKDKEIQELKATLKEILG